MNSVIIDGVVIPWVYYDSLIDELVNKSKRILITLDLRGIK